MKNVRFACLILMLVVSTTLAGNTTIDPGSESTLSQDPPTGGTFTNNGNFTFTLLSAFDSDARTIKAFSGTTATSIGTGTASAQMFYDFEVGGTPETAGNTVGAWISYVADWSGSQIVGVAGVGNSSVEIEILLRDLTGSSNLHLESVHELDLKTKKVKFVLIGIDFDDSDIKANTFPAVLKRGHTYRLTMRMSTTVFLLAIPTSGFVANSNYFATGAKLHSLNVKVGLDEKEVLERLESFENHRHIYLTGRGEGHNNTQATSSPPVLPRPSKKLFPQTLLEEDVPFIKPEPVTSSKPIFEKP